jgi:iron complex transport system substrate-binding protein
MNLADDLGRRFTLHTSARRIISLAPAISENLFAIGAGSLLVGVTTADDYPPAVKRLPRVGDFGQPSVERIRALRSDLAIVESATLNRATVENAEKRLQVPIFVQTSRRFTDVPRHLEQLGQITGHAPAAATAARNMRATQDKVTRGVAGQPRVTVFVEVGRSPLFAAGPGSFVDDLILLAGGVNVVKGNNPFPAYSKESLLAANPEHYIIATGGDMGSDAPSLPPPLDRIAAAKKGNIHRISSDLLFRPTPRLADGLVALARALHPPRT